MRATACHVFLTTAVLAATSITHPQSQHWTWGGSAGEPVFAGCMRDLGSRGLGSLAHLRLRGGGDDYASMRATFLSGAAGGSPKQKKPASAVPREAPGGSASTTWTAPPPSQPPVTTPRKTPWGSRPTAQRGAAAGGWRGRGGRGGWGGGRGAGQEKGKGGCKIVLSLSSTSTFVATSTFPPAGVKEACVQLP